MHVVLRTLLRPKMQFECEIWGLKRTRFSICFASRRYDTKFIVTSQHLDSWHDGE